MSGIRYTNEFKVELAKQATDHGHPVADVARRLGRSLYCLYSWARRCGESPGARKAEEDQVAELRSVKADLRSVMEERNVLKKAAAYFAKESGVQYAFMRAHRDRFRLILMCRVLKVNCSGYYAWLASPLSARGKEDRRITGLIKHAWLESVTSSAYREWVGKHY